MLQKIDVENTSDLKAYLDGRAASINSDILIKTQAILDQVIQDKDQALIDLTEKFDGIKLNELKVSQEVLDEAAEKADEDFKEALTKAAENIEAYHKHQLSDGYTMDSEYGVQMGQRVMPLAAVGLYVPGGRAQYPSSVLMNAIPAKVAGVKRIVMVTPPSKDGSISPNLAAAAKAAGVSEIYTVGGAQAVAALAYGTESIEPVDKIVGPGNIFVAAAKKLVFGKVDIDMIAGPSEILVIADETANPKYVAADLLSQAEHDPMASAILISTSEKLIEEVNQELERQSALLPKKAIIDQSLKNYGKSLLVSSIEEAGGLANAIAPEHLELQVKDPMKALDLIVNAGSVFVGDYSCESVGDYYAGVNHVLPTSGTARFSSALSVDSFIKKSSWLRYTKDALMNNGKRIMNLAFHEQLDGHANAVGVRLEDE